MEKSKTNNDAEKRQIEIAQKNLFSIGWNDVIVTEKDWKRFRKTASREEKATIAFGAKCRMSGVSYFIKAIISVLGAVASLAIGFSLLFGSLSSGFLGLFLIIGGYGFFSFLSSKLTGYQWTYFDCKYSLTKEEREYIKNVLSGQNFFVRLLRFLVAWALLIITLPYRLILTLIVLFIPPAKNWAIAHGGDGGVVVPIPKGYDIGNLAAMGEYYRSCTFGDAWDKQMEHVGREQAARNQYKVSEGGYTRTLTYLDRDAVKGVDRFEDDLGRKWIKSADDGMFYLEND